MILPDANILLYAYDSASPHHPAASKWLDRVLSSEQVYFSWHTLTAFLRISTNPRIWMRPLTIDQAIEVVNSWLELDNAHIVGLEKRNWPLFVEMLTKGQAAANLVMDAHLAALAASCGAKLATTDRDFTRFPNLQLLDPVNS
jgi:toxin-antitoxin system PIN domain toxin